MIFELYSYLNFPNFTSMQISIDTIGTTLAPLVAAVISDTADIANLTTFTAGLSANVPLS